MMAQKGPNFGWRQIDTGRLGKMERLRFSETPFQGKMVDSARVGHLSSSGLLTNMH